MPVPLLPVLVENLETLCQSPVFCRLTYNRCMADDDPEKPDDSSNPIDQPLNSPPLLEQSIWATLLTAQIQVPRGIAIGSLNRTIFDFSKIDVPRFEFPKMLPTINLQAFDIKLPKIDFDHVFRTMEEVIQQLAMRCWSLHGT